VQEAIPDVPSDPDAVTWTEWVYHPFESGLRSALTELRVGAVASRLIVTI
jgi:hypothetical protein